MNIRCEYLIGASTSGKSRDFGSRIPRFESWRPSQRADANVEGEAPLALPMEGATGAPVITKRQVTRFSISHSHVRILAPQPMSRRTQ